MVPRAAVLAWITTLLGSLAVAVGPDRHFDRPDEWFAGEDGRRVAAATLSHQSELGGWPKNRDTTIPFTGTRATLVPT